MKQAPNGTLPNKRGRKPIDNPADETLMVRIQRDRKTIYELAAQKAGETLSQWVLSACDRRILS